MGRSWVKFVKRLGKRPLYVYFGQCGRHMLAFDNEELSIQRLKNSFVCNVWSWSRLSIDMNPISHVSFIDWLGS